MNRVLGRARPALVAFRGGRSFGNDSFWELICDEHGGVWGAWMGWLSSLAKILCYLLFRGRTSYGACQAEIEFWMEGWAKTLAACYECYEPPQKN